MTRREFFAALGRVAAAGALAAIGFKATRKPDGSRDAVACVTQGWCAPCGAVETCGLPRALSYRRDKGGAS